MGRNGSGVRGSEVVADAETLRELEKELRRCRPREIVRPVVLPHEEAESQQDERRKRARKEVEDSAVVPAWT